MTRKVRKRIIRRCREVKMMVKGDENEREDHRGKEEEGERE